MNIFPDTRLLIETEQLLSSSSYPVKHQFLCVFCHQPVELELLDYGKDVHTVHRCLCDQAQKELRIKSAIIEQLSELDFMTSQMDLNRIGTALYYEEVNKLKKRYRPSL